jgi:hypothetical protein
MSTAQNDQIPPCAAPMLEASDDLITTVLTLELEAGGVVARRLEGRRCVFLPDLCGWQASPLVPSRSAARVLRGVGLQPAGNGGAVQPRDQRPACDCLIRNQSHRRFLVDRIMSLSRMKAAHVTLASRGAHHHDWGDIRHH